MATQRVTAAPPERSVPLPSDAAPAGESTLLAHSSESGRSYRLEGLPPVYQKEGTRIRFRGRRRGPGDLAPWSTVLELIDVSGV